MMNEQKKAKAATPIAAATDSVIQPKMNAPPKAAESNLTPSKPVELIHISSANMSEAELRKLEELRAMKAAKNYKKEEKKKPEEALPKI